MKTDLQRYKEFLDEMKIKYVENELLSESGEEVFRRYLTIDNVHLEGSCDTRLDIWFYEDGKFESFTPWGD